MKGDALDPKALIREAYRMDIGVEEARVIFLDWALGVPEGENVKQSIARLLIQYGDAKDHPMTGVLREGLETATKTGRRGGRRGRMN